MLNCRATRQIVTGSLQLATYPSSSLTPSSIAPWIIPTLPPLSPLLPSPAPASPAQLHTSSPLLLPIEGDAAEFLDGRIAKPTLGAPTASSPTSLRSEAFALYRLVLRTTRPFLWTNESGVPWRDLLRASARSEFEACRWERDPEMVMRMLVQGRDAVQVISEKLAKKRDQILKEEAKLQGR